MIVEETVPAMSLSELFETQGVARVDLLQIDTEGYDAAIVGMIDFALCRPQLIKFEHKNVDARTYGDTLRRLQTNGYRCSRDGSDTVCALSRLLR
jgi:hypothetical protein